MRFRIKYQILLIAMIPVFLIDVFLTYVHINSSILQAEELLKSKGEIIAKQIAGASEFSLLSGDYEQIQHVLKQSINTNHIIFIAVYDKEGSILAEVESSQYKPEKSTEYSYYRQSIKTQNLDTADIFQPEIEGLTQPVRQLGWVHMYISKQQLQQNKKKIIYEGAIFFIAMLLVAVLLTLTISRRLTRPIYKLLRNLKKIETGELGDTIDKLESNEIGDVQRGFNSMSQSLLANRMQLDQKIKTATLELMNAITNLEYNNRELAIARDDAQKADQVKSQFLANMSHEIRTPINGINGFINLLLKTGLNHDQSRYAHIISQSTVDLSNIVNEILDFSKIESGKIEIQENQFDLYSLVESTRDSFYASTIEKNIDLYLTIYSDTQRILIGDSLRLKQILINLIGNAVKFTDEGFVSITVLMEDESEHQAMIQFKIEDSGIGITPENQKSLFQAFKQIESETNRRFAGSGLGLVISKNLAGLMGGDITLKSSLDTGTLFTLTIPFRPLTDAQNKPGSIPEKNKTVYILASSSRALREIQSLYNRINFHTETTLIEKETIADLLQSQLEQNLSYIDVVVIDIRHSKLHPDTFISDKIRKHCKVIIMHYDLSLINKNEYTHYKFISIINSSADLDKFFNPSETVQKEPQIPLLDAPDISSRNLLIVDDNLVNLELACELTKLWGHYPDPANNAKQAMEKFNNKTYDLILLDIQMPEIDGIEVMQMMREANPELTTAIIAITANAQETERDRLINLGFDAYISKPIDEVILKELLNKQQPIIQPQSSNNKSLAQIESIDYKLTYQLSANNHNLVRSTFTMLQLEIPDFIKKLKKSLKETDIKNISAIMHKLRGITCYVGLPKLKQLLIEFDSLKNQQTDQRFITTGKIIDELTILNSIIADIDKQVEKSVKHEPTEIN